jgi:hypothetical protein
MAMLTTGFGDDGGSMNNGLSVLHKVSPVAKHAVPRP